MPPVTHTVDAEAAFMADLLVDLDSSFWNAVPTPDPSPRKPTPTQILTPRRRDAQNPAVKPLAPSPSKVFSAGEVDMATLLEGAENWDWDDMNSDVLTPKKTPRKGKTKADDVQELPRYIPETCTRCIVELVTESYCNGHLEKNLIVKIDPGEERCSVVLRDDWTSMDVRVGDTINVLGTFTLITPSTSSITRSITITSRSNLLIHHPDLLITATALANAPQCRRKPILSNLVRSTSDTTPSLVWGSMLHEVMQSCLREGRWETAWVDQKIDEVVLRGLNELIKINVTIEQAKREVTTRAKGLVAFAERYISDLPKPDAILSDTRTAHDQGDSLLAITELLDIEEDIWSPTYGIKGKLDATVNTVISHRNPPFSQPILAAGPKPLELKTGRAVAGMEHRAQTMLYTLLAAERYGVAVPSGLLYYTQSEEVVHVPAGRNEIRGLIVARNEMASYMMRRSDKTGEHLEGGEGAVSEQFLPPTIDDERVCKRCYALDTCMLYRKAVENVIDSSSPIADIYELKTSHLTPTRSSFFKKWEALISLEEQDLVRFKKELWTMGAAEREAKGRCFSSMVLDPSFRPPPCPEGPTSPGNKIHNFSYRFIRQSVQGESASLLNGHINAGDAITVSVEPNLLALARGFVTELTPTEVVVGVDHKVCVDSIAKRLTKSSPGSSVIFRIDKDELFGGMGRIRDNLAQLFYADGDTRRLELVVDLRRPVFDDQPPQLSASLLSHSAHLNAHQAHAMKKVLSAHDYALILGMPGTGKTTVIAAMIKTLVAMGKTVLLTSYTHSAVDTILAKLLDADFRILRLGNLDKIRPDVHRFTLAKRKTPTTIEQLKHQLMTPPVVATTCLSIDHGLFAQRKFDYCIVDEASQITLPTCLGPLRYADTFVLVGDHFQLPPLVRNPAARKGGLDVSLFRRLSDAHPQAVVDLAYQYRMNEDIMLLSNKLIYGNRLRCGSEAVASRSLVLPEPDFLHGLHAGSCPCHSDGCWIEALMSESCKAVFVDTDSLPAHDSRVGDLVENKTEGQLVFQLASTLLRCGIREEQIGVITLYRQQVKLLGNLLQRHKDIEILTADRSQGRDKDCIIISMVRSNDSGYIGDLVKDWRRMNVSFTRARSKLIIIGSRKTLQAAGLLAEFFTLMDSRGWILQLPPNAHLLHATLFSPPATPSSKRVAEEDVIGSTTARENATLTPPRKKVKVPTAQSGLLKGRPILKDLVNDEGYDLQERQ
ncbi:putative DNA replication factor Dna2 [Lyophyllum shimeji]|uniref:DNA replication ATP-dependent helicase/nuclease DNA2 n=1 Tax=Lyophyllum shimeji TaxID=47721 RepID=A0A9P3PRA9_LYOSH|nr:putative DNA replication factor Dna2 [Lyophyllum shimeji]